ncbi:MULTISPECIES: invasion associated locus B family protein [unclassified Methylobacterium]|uniref:invasion associated locus B family protein n=1 Tax=unclassified Methylobacterium TaxID=2615210 RepID=UPI001FBA777F|nr:MULTISPECIES: invasion associated locus B family protein [unclassified Methylobacterium]MCJ2091044.1 invasion associated locus B family protein [Methylobacterium sp. J-072]MCJ2138811.1 invasion associated locus B family protein [Methylobacterium sp. E-066]
MSFTRPATLARAALLGLVGLGLAAAPALAQAKKPAAPAPTAPAPAAPNTPAANNPAGAAAQTGPQIVTVKSEPSQADWTKVCGKDQASGTDICYTTRDFVSDQGQPVLAVAVYEMKNAAQKQEVRVVRYLLPLGLLLQPGIRFNVDGQAGTPGRFAVCFPNGCFAEAGGVDAGVIAAMKKGTTLNVSVQNQTQREVTFAVPLTGFGKAFDGPAIDPKVLEEQQKKLQAELEKRSEDMRKKLEQQGNAAPAAGAPAAK